MDGMCVDAGSYRERGPLPARVALPGCAQGRLPARQGTPHIQITQPDLLNTSVYRHITQPHSHHLSLSTTGPVLLAEPTLTPHFLSVCQALNKGKAASSVEEVRAQIRADPTIVATAFKTRRFYLFTRRMPVRSMPHCNWERGGACVRGDGADSTA
jgi:hypothetical protein